MLLLRKIDFYAQTVIGVLTIVSTPFLLYYGFLAGLFLVGCWQLFSAALNSSTFLKNGMGKQICNYWKYTGLILGSLFLCYPLSEIFKADDVQVLAGISICCAAPVAVYYYMIYKKLVENLSFRKDVGRLIKSSH